MRIFIFLFLLIQLPLSAGCQCNALDNGTGKPSEALLEILDMFDIRHDGTWESIQRETEKAWLKHGKSTERWEIEPIANPYPEKTYALFYSLGMVQTLFAQTNYYDYGVVLGATVQVARQRFWFLKSLMEQGVCFPMIVVLTGDRPLDPNLESEKILIDPSYSAYPFRKNWRFSGNLPRNETEMMQLVFDQLDLPEAFRHIPVIFVDTPKPEGMKRPHTEHTVLQWLAMNPTPGSVLAVSNQPFICRQRTLLDQYLPSSYSLDAVGEGFSFEQFLQKEQATAILLAELAYWIKIYAASATTSLFSTSRN